MIPLPAWVSDWSQFERGVPIAAEGVEWVRSRPDPVKALLRRFPPSCVVRVSTARFHPRVRDAFREWDDFAIVRSLWEGGQLGLSSPDTNDVRWRVEQRDVAEVVAYHRGMTPEWVAQVLA